VLVAVGETLGTVAENGLICVLPMMTRIAGGMTVQSKAAMLGKARRCAPPPPEVPHELPRD